MPIDKKRKKVGGKKPPTPPPSSSESSSDEESSDDEVETTPHVAPVANGGGAAAAEPESDSESSSSESEIEEAAPTKRPRTRSMDAGELTGAVAVSAKGAPMAVSNFKLSEATVVALAGRGIDALFEIQAKTFDLIREGADVIGRARTGQGKTLAFALPIAELLQREDGGKGNKSYGRAPAAVVLAPTRELAQQVSKEIESVCPGFEVLCIYGGSPYPPQFQALRAGVDVVVGTTGRIKDHLEKQTLDLAKRCKLAVLDEADQMLDMGFADDMEIILGACTNPERQTCLFSATMPKWVSDVAKKYMRNPTTIDVVGNSAVKASTDVRHITIPSHWTSRGATISDTIAMYGGTNGRCIVFCETKLECNDLSVDDSLKFENKALHGDVPQNTREQTMAAFRKGKFRVLIATDVAARGLDMIVDLVIQNKPPESRSGRPEVETYVHRSGRTGRAGRKGVCVTLFAPKQRACLQTIERSTGNSFEWCGAPQPKAIMLTAAQTAVDDALGVDQSVRTSFAPAAAQLLEKCNGDPHAALQAALAVATGYTEAPPMRSLLNSSEGFATLQFDGQGATINALGFVWNALRKVFPEGFTDGSATVRGLQLTVDEMGAVLDVKVESSSSSSSSSDGRAAAGGVGVTMDELKTIVENCDFLSFCDTLPPLKEKYAPPGGGGGGGGGRGGKGGRGKGGGGKGGGGKGKGGKGSPFGKGRGKGGGRF